MKQAEKIITDPVFTLNKYSKTHEPLNSNEEVRELLQGKMVSFTEILGQDTYVFGDGSYITRLVDEYFHGDDITMFEIIQDEQSGSTFV